MSTLLGLSQAWCRTGVLGRIAPGAGDGLTAHLDFLGSGEDRLPIDGVIVAAADLATRPESLERAREQGLRVVVELQAPDATNDGALEDQAAAWLDRGIEGISLEDVSDQSSPDKSKVTRLFPAPPRATTPSPRVETLRRALGASSQCPLLLREPAAPGSSPLPAGADVVLHTALLEQNWQARGMGRAIEACEKRPGASWPGYAVGAPRRGPLGRLAPSANPLACAMALALTLRGTPCLELGAGRPLFEPAPIRQWTGELLALRRRQAALRRGAFRFFHLGGSVLGFLREYQAERIAVLLNFARLSRRGRLPEGFPWRVLLASDASCPARLPGGEVRLRPQGVLIARAGTPLSRSLGGSGQRRATGG